MRQKRLPFLISAYSPSFGTHTHTHSPRFIKTRMGAQAHPTSVYLRLRPRWAQWWADKYVPKSFDITMLVKDP